MQQYKLTEAGISSNSSPRVQPPLKQSLVSRKKDRRQWNTFQSVILPPTPTPETLLQQELKAGQRKINLAQKSRNSYKYTTHEVES